MCIICVSRSGIRQPTVSSIRSMFKNNPHGAGFMYARDGKVHISKGYMDVDEYIEAVERANFTAADSVVYHFRISTQAGVGPAMTHPFPLSNQLEHMKALEVTCPCGVAHNGVIMLTTDPSNHEYSDTAIFIVDYLSGIIKCGYDLRDQETLDYIFHLARSKFAIMDGTGYVATIGTFINNRGLLFSNDSFQIRRLAL